MTHVTPYDRLAVDAEEMERLLASGEQARELINYFGPAEYEELADLARAARHRRGARAEQVYVVPGIMGSQLGLRREAPSPVDVIWLDPIDIAFGRLFALRHVPESRIVPLGVLPFGYLRLKLELERAGYDVTLYDYDWRRGVDELGATFAARLHARTQETVHLVAHSLGGLVARAALRALRTDKVARLVMLGTPHFGSFAPVQALRGVYPLVRRIAALDLRHSAEELATQLFAGFESIYHLLPAGVHAGAQDFFDPASWPGRGPQPVPAQLATARGLDARLAPADERVCNVVGVGQDTVTGAVRRGEEFEYIVTRNGDGTVPAALATLPGARNYYFAAAHSELPRNRQVLPAIVDLLAGGATDRLAAHWSTSRAPLVQVSEARLRRTHLRKIDWAKLSPRERREYLEQLNDPPHFARTTGKWSRAAGRVGAATGRDGRPRRGPRAGALEITLSAGDITRANAEALVAAVLQGVRPAGAIAAIDARIGGVIGRLAAQRMFSGEAGSVTAIPAVRGVSHAHTVLLAGLGSFDRLGGAALELAAQNVVRWCAQSRIRRIATVLWGAGTGISPERSFADQLRGYLRALSEGGQDSWRVVFCVPDPRQLARLARRAPRLVAEAGQAFPEGPAVTLSVRGRRRPSRAAAGDDAVPQTTHLLMHEEAAPRGMLAWRCAVLTAGRQAAVLSEVQAFSARALDTHLRSLERLTFAQLAAFGMRLAEVVLHPSVRALLHATREHPLAIVHDAAGSRIPWEALCLRGHFPAAGRGMSRRYTAGELPVARFSERRRRDGTLAVLLVTNPTGDLPGADLERERLTKLLARLPAARVTSIQGAAATRARILAEIQSGTYDAIHYAGHAAFEAGAPARSGLRCSDATLTGEDLGGLAQVPALVVFNACESARIRRRGSRPHAARLPARAERMRTHAGVAEAVLRGGVACYVGTYWPVGDAEALAFSETLYARMLGGVAMGDAVLAARRAVRALRSIDWADYVHYGDPQFLLKELG